MPKKLGRAEAIRQYAQPFCGVCNQIVHFCYSPEDLMKAIQGDLCVAIANNPANEGPYMLGRLTSMYNSD
jgi:hypothetical protein